MQYPLNEKSAIQPFRLFVKQPGRIYFLVKFISPCGDRCPTVIDKSDSKRRFIRLSLISTIVNILRSGSHLMLTLGFKENIDSS